MAPATNKPPSPRKSFAAALGGDTLRVSSAQKLVERHMGFPAISFSEEEVNALSIPYQFSLIGRFSKSRPPLEAIRKSFDSIGFKEGLFVGLLAPSTILLQFQCPLDYHCCFSKRLWKISGAAMIVSKWTPQYHVDFESSIFPVWVSMEHLPIHLYESAALFSIANLIGTPLMMDTTTAAKTRPSKARVCVEVDVSRTPPSKIWINNGSCGFFQTIVYEDLPDYCTSCNKSSNKKGLCSRPDQGETPAALKTTATCTAGNKENNIHQELPSNSLGTSASPVVHSETVAEVYLGPTKYPNNSSISKDTSTQITSPEPIALPSAANDFSPIKELQIPEPKDVPLCSTKHSDVPLESDNAHQLLTSLDGVQVNVMDQSFAGTKDPQIIETSMESLEVDDQSPTTAKATASTIEFLNSKEVCADSEPKPTEGSKGYEHDKSKGVLGSSPEATPTLAGPILATTPIIDPASIDGYSDEVLNNHEDNTFDTIVYHYEEDFTLVKRKKHLHRVAPDMIHTRSGRGYHSGRWATPRGRGRGRCGRGSEHTGWISFDEALQSHHSS